MLKRRRSRSRSLSRSPPVKIPHLMKLLRLERDKKRMRELEAIPLPRVYDILIGFFGTTYHDKTEFKYYSFHIPSESIACYRKADFNDDIHYCQRLPHDSRLTLLNESVTQWFVYTKAVLVGRELYVIASNPPDMFSWKRKFQLITLDLDSGSGWKEFHVPLPFELYTTPNSVIIYLRGCLFVLGAYPTFGALFDFNTQLWSQLDSPKGITFDSDDVHLIASLGESMGMFLVHVDTCFDAWIFFYDVPSHTWLSHCGDPLDNGHMIHHRIFDKPILVHEPNGIDTLYFFKDNSIVYAFELQTMKLFQAPLEGFGKITTGHGVHTALMHFGGDLFCLSFGSFFPIPEPHEDVPAYSTIHFTFIRVIKDSNLSTLRAFTVGCNEYVFDDVYLPHGALSL